MSECSSFGSFCTSNSQCCSGNCDRGAGDPFPTCMDAVPSTTSFSTTTSSTTTSSSSTTASSTTSSSTTTTSTPAGPTCDAQYTSVQTGGSVPFSVLCSAAYLVDEAGSGSPYQLLATQPNNVASFDDCMDACAVQVGCYGVNWSNSLSYCQFLGNIDGDSTISIFGSDYSAAMVLESTYTQTCESQTPSPYAGCSVYCGAEYNSPAAPFETASTTFEGCIDSCVGLDSPCAAVNWDALTSTCYYLSQANTDTDGTPATTFASTINAAVC